MNRRAFVATLLALALPPCAADGARVPDEPP